MKKIIYLLTFFVILTACENEIETAKESTFGEIPGTASIGDTIAVKGENFPLELKDLKIFFDENESKIIALTNNEIRFKVPVIQTQESIVTVRFKNQVIQSFPFKLGLVTITNVSEKVKLGELCKLYGKNFQSLLSPTLIINGVEIKPSSIDENGMGFNLPNILYPDRKVKISVKDASLSSELGYDAKITDKWVRVAYSPFVKRDLFSAFIFKGEGYILGNNQEHEKKVNYFYKLNPTTYKYQQDTVPIQTTSAFATPNHVYYVINSTDIFEYNFSDKSSTYVTSRPNSNKNRFYYFTVGEDIYCLQEFSYFGDIDPLGSLFFKFDYQSKTWQNKTAPSTIKTFARYSATVGTDIYFIKDTRTLVRYNSITDSWTQDLNNPVINGSKFNLDVIYGNGLSVYALYNIDGLEYMYEYLTSNGKWQNLGAIISSPTYNFFGFFIGNKHFIGGFKHDMLSSDLFESDNEHIFLF